MYIYGTRNISKPTKEQVIEATNQLKDFLKQLECKIDHFQVDNYDKTLLREKMSRISYIKLSITDFLSQTSNKLSITDFLFQTSNLRTLHQTCSEIQRYIYGKGPLNEECEIHELLAKIDPCVFILRRHLDNVNTFFG